MPPVPELDPITICEVGSRSIRGSIGSTKHTQLCTLNGSTDTARGKADKAGLRSAGVTIRLKSSSRPIVGCR